MAASIGTETLLSADEIATRLAIYDPDRDFSLALAEIWREARSEIVAATAAHWQAVVDLPHNAGLSAEGKAALIASAIDNIEFRFTVPFGERWVSHVASLGRLIFHTDVPAHMVAMGLHRHGDLIVRAISPGSPATRR